MSAAALSRSGEQALLEAVKSKRRGMFHVEQLEGGDSGRDALVHVGDDFGNCLL